MAQAPAHPPDARAATFAALWAVGMLFHATVFHEWFRPPWAAALPLAALWLLARPASVPRLLLLAGAQVAVSFHRIPVVPNHWLLTFFMNAAILCAWLRLALARRSLAIDAALLHRTFAPVLRVLTLLLYFFATFHKLNMHYFSPELSCAVREFETLRRVLPIVPDAAALRLLVIYGSVATETGIFALLLLPRTRNAGLLLAGAFHLLLSLNVYHGFTSILFALFFLFTDASFPERAASAIRGLRGRLPDPASRALPRAARAVGWLCVPLFALLALRDTVPPWSTIYGVFERALFFLYAPSLYLLFVATLRAGPGRAPGTWRALRIPYASLAVFPLIVAGNGAAPYLGLKTEGSFAMFSNLRTEGGVTNHYLVPWTLRLGGYDDLVTLLDTPFERLNRVQARGGAVTWFDLRSAASREPEASLRFVRRGQTRAVERVADDPELSKPWPWPVRKFVRFRHVRKPYGSCQH